MTYTIGLVPSPGVAHKLVDNAIPKINSICMNGSVMWINGISSKVDLLIGSAEDVHEV